MKRLRARHETEHFTIDFIADAFECDYGPGTPTEYEPRNIEVAHFTLFDKPFPVEQLHSETLDEMIDLIDDRDWVVE